jgi:hypothetical protein
MINMKKLNLLLGTLMATAALSHAVDSYSDVVGYQKATLSANSYKGIGIALLNPSVISGSVSSKSGYVVTVSGASSLGASLEASPAAYYLEVTSPTNSPNIGDRFEVDVAATKSANNGTVVLATSPRNTANASSASLAANTGVVVRKHVTFDQLRASISGTLTGNDDSMAAADIIYIHNGTGFSPYWLGSDLQTWLSSEDPDDHRYEVIAPGQGILFYKKGASATFTSTGTVRSNDYKQVLSAGYQLNASGFPKSYSPLALGGALNNGWSPNDKIYVHNGIGFGSIVLETDGTSEGFWNDGENPDPANTVTIVDGNTAFLTKLNSAVTDIESKP